MYPWWLLYVAVGFFALAATTWLLAYRHLRPGWLDERDPRGLPLWARRSRPMWDNFERAGQRWLLVHWGGLLAFVLCLLAFVAAARSP
jgi:hypothetical protein